MEDLSWILEDMDEDDLLDIEDELKEKEEEMNNLLNLPPYCFTIDPKDGKIVRLNRGEKGYQPLDSLTSQYSSAIQEAFLIGGKHLRDKARIVSRDKMNEEIGVTKQQHDAMLHGSHCGFDNPAVYKILNGDMP